MLALTIGRRALSRAATATATATTAGTATARRPSPTSVGRAFEERTIAMLVAAGLDLRGTGGAFDGGIDFRGFLGPPGGVRVPVIGQCKAEARKCGARYLRDFEGVLAREPKCLGIFVTLAGYSVHAQHHFLGSAFPLVLVRATDRLESLQVNAAAQILLPGLTVGSRISMPGDADTAASSTAVLRTPRLLFTSAMIASAAAA